MNTPFKPEAISLRDYLAGHVVAGILANTQTNPGAFNTYVGNVYKIVDLLLEERVKTQVPTEK